MMMTPKFSRVKKNLPQKFVTNSKLKYYGAKEGLGEGNIHREVVLLFLLVVVVVMLLSVLEDVALWRAVTVPYMKVS
jgi:hypothetical protein